MKNFEKYIDKYAKLISDYCYHNGCKNAPCQKDCARDVEHKECEEFFKAWALMEVDEE